ncbi:putative membrane protein [Pedobacter glucosidilyticus]|nr:acyltransferase [Pedobacter glucosidilyticus]KHJ36979.1 putative membrane protein [Pedobacter glucosidilyticus]
MEKQRVHSLDSLRGIAAFQVILAHSLVAIPSLNWMRDMNSIPDTLSSHLIHSPLHFFWSDTEPVILFFVLSGFVLSLSFYSSQSLSDYPSFFIKRIIRLYIPCLAIILISILLKLLLFIPNSLSGFGEWVIMMWTIPINVTVLKNILILNSAYLDYFDRSLWSLGPEIKLSLILPFYIYLTKKLGPLSSTFSIILFFISYHSLVHFNFHKIWNDFSTLYYFTFFILGSIICKYRTPLLAFINKTNIYLFWILIIIAIYAYTFNFSMWWLPNNIIIILKPFSNQITAISAAILIIISLSYRAQAFLNNKLLLFMGKISFSIYLIHAVVITTFAYLLNSFLPTNYIIFIAFIFCFPLAYLFYKIIEKPSLHLAIHYSKYSGINKGNKK